MRFSFHHLLLEIDVARTQAFYRQAPRLTDGCDCDGCRNYLLAVADFPPPVMAFLQQLGIDAAKAAEVFVWNAEDDGAALHYGGFYHLCGRFVSGDDCWQDNGAINRDAWAAVADGYAVGFTRRVSLAEENLPSPAIQMEIDFHAVPWKLDQTNPY